MISLPLMDNNITPEDVEELISFLKGTDRFTQGPRVRQFEDEFSEWLGVKYSLFVNSGANANLITVTALKYLYGAGEIIVPALTWSSDISSVIFNGFTPVFVDISMKNLAMDEEKILSAITSNTKAVFLTHVLGFNGLSGRLLDELAERNIILLEDVCESMGAEFNGRKLGTIGLASNFSFYYAHHMSTIEGGMVCTNDEEFYQTLRMLRSHGMLRECTSQRIKDEFTGKYPDVNEEFFFAYPAFNVRSTELNAVIGINQLKRVDANNELRRRNFKLFLDNLDSKKYFTEFDIEGSCNYALTLILREPDAELFSRVVNALSENGVEYRRGTAGGGSMLIQPFTREYAKVVDIEDFNNVRHVHFYGLYIGNFPSMDTDKILAVCGMLNSL